MSLASKTRRCSTCRKKCDTELAILSHLKAFCSYSCMQSYLSTKTAKKRVQAAKTKETAERKEKLKTRSDRIKEAQAAFNRYIRLRDQNKGCISCGSMPEQKVGGTMDAGHYLSRGARPQHRFNLINVAGQCVKCNRYLSGAPADFRLGLMRRWGLDKIIELECDNKPNKLTEDYLIRLKDIFNRRANLYQRKFR